MATPDWIVATLRVTATLEALGVSYVIGGSVASIIHGELRTTMDADLVADLRIEHMDGFTTEIERDFYVDATSMREAIIHCRSFNVIHRQTMFKVDIFILKPRPFDRAQIERRTQRVLAREPDRTAWVASAEDNVLAKLEWFDQGGRVSDRQWRDILGVLRIRADELDVAYMRRSAPAIGVAGLLEEALQAAAQD